LALREGQPDRQEGTRRWVEDCERLAALEPRLPEILAGAAGPDDARTQLVLAEYCLGRKFDAAAARFYREAFAAEPKLADDRSLPHRYNAACAAALSGSGRGQDDPKPDALAKSALRRQAHEWLEAELASWAKVLGEGRASARQVVVRTLISWKADPDLACVRETSALADLSGEELEAWHRLWAKYEALLENARAAER
jgi:eukaryotic-like serine/threonine-protein kinase